MKPVEPLPLQGQEPLLRSLLDYLALARPKADVQWHDWRVARIDGGWCNLLYRATGPLGDLAVKFTIRDSRDRAGREYGALSALHRAGFPIAPQPILLDRDSYEQPVVVLTWLEGEVSAAPPATEVEWHSLLQHLATLHAIRPDRITPGTIIPGGCHMPLPQAVIDASSVAEGKDLVLQQMVLLPTDAQPVSLQVLVRRLEEARFPALPAASASLCRLDHNTTNYIRRPGLWGSVDWENSGWGDPAFGIANLITHPAYMEVPLSRWDWVIDAYCDLAQGDAIATRIRTHWKIMLVWWVARIARYLYEIPRGLDERLVSRPPGWQADMQAKYRHYLRWAEAMYA